MSLQGTPATLADGVTTSKTGAVMSVASGGVSATQLAAQAVTAAKIASGAVDGVTITGGNGTALFIPNNGITSSLIASGAVGSSQLTSQAVTAAKIATSAVDGTTLTGGNGTSLSIATGGVGTTQLASQAVTAAKIATGAVDGVTITGGNGSALAVVTGSINNTYLKTKSAVVTSSYYLPASGQSITTSEITIASNVTFGSGFGCGIGDGLTLTGLAVLLHAYWTVQPSAVPTFRIRKHSDSSLIASQAGASVTSNISLIPLVSTSLDLVTAYDFSIQLASGSGTVTPDIWAFPYCTVTPTVGAVITTSKVVVKSVDPSDHFGNVFQVNYTFGAGTTATGAASGVGSVAGPSTVSTGWAYVAQAATQFGGGAVPALISIAAPISQIEWQ